MAERRWSSVRCPTRYELVVFSELGDRFASACGGMEVYADGGITRIVGLTRDQSQLHGLLDRIRDLSIELVSVNPIVEGQPADRHAVGGR